jgi:hypothetical protein
MMRKSCQFYNLLRADPIKALHARYLSSRVHADELIVRQWQRFEIWRLFGGCTTQGYPVESPPADRATHRKKQKQGKKTVEWPQLCGLEVS